jgi:hypothetical protein
MVRKPGSRDEYVMGANCSILGCNISRKNSGISIFDLPKGEDDLSKKTREEWVKQITRNRVVDQDLKRQIEARTLHVCERHFEGRYIEKRKFCNIMNIFEFIYVFLLQVCVNYQCVTIRVCIILTYT